MRIAQLILHIARRDAARETTPQCAKKTCEMSNLIYYDVVHTYFVPSGAPAHRRLCVGKVN
ncbi:MAG: hypothetical protein OJF49_000463 [Ktedonobacterales bacterium]|nr:MAG: hypothetical protein OJF49_000463 [Ktedonobacterales bacterium]